MGKKGSWFTALKRAFTSSSSSSKDKPINGLEKKYVKEKKRWGVGRSRHGEINSFIPLYREPSSIEKILGDAERETLLKSIQGAERETHHKIQGAERGTHLKIQGAERETHLKIRGAERETHLKIHQERPKKIQQSKIPASKQTFTRKKPNIFRENAQISAIKIQAAYRGYTARKSYRALKGLVRLQRVMVGQGVKRQTMNTMKCMQLLVRVQSQVRARRLQMMESRSVQQHQTSRRSEKEIESSLGRWSLTPRSDTEGGGGTRWDDTALTKEERDARTQRKVEAVMKRERALAYAYSHQLLNVTPKSAHAVLTDIRSGGFPWWWNWLERQRPYEPPHPIPPHKTPQLIISSHAAASTPRLRPSSRSSSKAIDAPTPRSFKPVPSPRAKYPPISSNRWQTDDNDSLTSCPAFTGAVPNYMAPTASAKAKVRGQSFATDRNEEKRRFSFSLTQSFGSLRWSKGSTKENVPVVLQTQRKHKSTPSIGGMSVDSAASMPVGVGRKPFK